MTRHAINDTLIMLLEAQPEIVPSSATVPPESLTHAWSVLADVAAELRIPVVCSIVPMGPNTPDVIDELKAKGPLAIRTTISAFDDAALRDIVANSGMKHIVIGGVSSEIAVFHTARRAREHGYAVSLLADACGGLSERTEAAAFAQLRAAGIDITNVSTFLTGLIGDMNTPAGSTVMKAVARLWRW